MGKVVTIEFETEEDCKRYFASLKAEHAQMPFAGVTSIGEDYHTPHELYEHRYHLYRALCFSAPFRLKAWRSRLHHDGTMFKDSFIVGINLVTRGYVGRNDITYHLPNNWWDSFEGLTTYDKAPEYDGASPEEGLRRLEAFTHLLAGYH